MIQIKPEVLEYEFKRWARPDAHLFVRSDWQRYVSPRSDLAKVYECYGRKYRHDQPRVPAGSHEGGRWTDDGGQSAEGDAGDRVRVAQADNGIVTDVSGQPYYNSGGHHEVARGVYTKWSLRSETRAVFENSTTGKIPRILVRTSPDGVPQGHFWDHAHRRYNEAIKELGDQYLERSKITPEQMTPEQAREVLREIRESKDPRIRDYNSTIRLIRRIYRLRGGRE